MELKFISTRGQNNRLYGSITSIKRGVKKKCKRTYNMNFSCLFFVQEMMMMMLMTMTMTCQFSSTPIKENWEIPHTAGDSIVKEN